MSRPIIEQLDAVYEHGDHIPHQTQPGTLPDTKSDVLGHPIPGEFSDPSFVARLAMNEASEFTEPSWYHQALNTLLQHAVTRFHTPPSWEHKSRGTAETHTLQALDRERSRAMLADVNTLKEHLPVLTNSMPGEALRDAVHTVTERALLRRVSHALAVRSRTVKEATDADALPKELDVEMLHKQPWSLAMTTVPEPSHPTPFFMSHGMAVQSGARKHTLESLRDYVDAVGEGLRTVDGKSPSDVFMTDEERAHHNDLSDAIGAAETAHKSMRVNGRIASSAAFLQHLQRIATLLDRRELTNRIGYQFDIDWSHDPYLDDGAPSHDATQARALAEARAKRPRTSAGR